MSEHDNYSEQDIATVTLTLDNDETVECAILTIYEVDGHKYIALLPLNEEGESEDGDVYLYRFIDTNPNEPELENILDDDEYEIAADAFDEWMDEQEFEEERRMFYVGMTRARQKLVISYIKEKNGKAVEPSRFVSELLVRS